MTNAEPQTGGGTNVPAGPSTGGGDAGGVPGGPTAPTTAGTGGVGGIPGVPAGSVPAPTSEGTSGGRALTPGQLAVLRKIATDADFRVLFARDPIAAITGAGLQLTTQDYTRLEQLDAAQLEQVATGINVLVGAGAASGLAPAEGTNTLLYAVIVALLLA